MNSYNQVILFYKLFCYFYFYFNLEKTFEIFTYIKDVMILIVKMITVKPMNPTRK